MRGIVLFALLAALVPFTAWAQQYQDEEPFVVPQDLQDPFVFVRSKLEGNDQEKIKTRERRRLEEERVAGAEKAEEAARTALENGRNKDAFDLCEQALKSLGEIDRPTELNRTAAYPNLSPLREQLLRVREAARRLHAREEIESAFRALNVRVSGVVVGENRATAVVNGTVLSAGDFLVVNGQPSEARIEEIRPGMIVVTFRGLKMPLPIR